MNKSPYAWPLLAVFSLLVGCGGPDPGPLPVNTSPTIADPGPVSVPELTANIVKLAVSDKEGNPVTLTLSGTDASTMSISNDGTLKFAIPTDFLAPADADHNNQYLVTVTASDTYTPAVSLNVVVNVTQVPGISIHKVSAHVTTDDTTFVKENILSSFEYPAVMQTQASLFTLTGAFASTTNWNNLEYNNANLAPIAARIGDASVTTCEIGGSTCDAPTGSITINDFVVTKDSISFLMSGGNGVQPVGVDAILASSGAVLGTYTPNSCGDPVLKGDQHYVNFDTSDLIGDTMRLRIFDEATTGCGFVAFDHFYQTDKPRGVVAAVLTKPLAPVHVTLEGAVALQKLIPKASFENPVDMVAKRGWVATGAFASPTATSWQGTTVNTAAARVGDKAISTCEMNGNSAGCDASVGTLTSPAFKVTDDYLNFLMAGGSATSNVGLRITDTVGNAILTYNPATCGPSYIDGDDDWTAINMAALKTAYVKAQLFDSEAAGCGFISTDHWYQSAAAWNPAGTGKNGGTVVLTNPMAATLGFNVTLEADAFTQVIGDFDDATVAAGVWTATGDFAGPASADAWKGTSGVARVGLRAVSTCEMNANNKGCDASTGTLTSPVFTVDAIRPYLNFLMAGGSATSQVGLKVLDAAGTTTLASYSPNSCGPPHIDGDNDWVTIDLTAQAGMQVRVQVYDNEPNGCGFVSFDHVHMSATRRP